MKIAVYTIALNEEGFVDRFMDCLGGEADGVYVSDTGSSDRTVERLRDRGAVVSKIKVAPWRFDVPRNASLAMVPHWVDVCVCIDLDEVLTPGWADAIRKSWSGGAVQADRMRYQYVWNTLPDGRDGTTFWYDKIHLRHGFRWVKPIHEVLAWYGERPERQVTCDGFKLRHLPDPTKSRGSYLQLLRMGCLEEPDDDRNSHYLGRELMYYGLWDEAIAELKRHLSLPRATWDAERAASMRYIGRCYSSKGDRAEAERWHLRACAEAPGTREPWVELGKLYHSADEHPKAYYAMKRALEIAEKPMAYLNDPEAWGALPWDLAGVSAWYMGMREESRKLFEEAARIEPNDERIRQNLRWARGEV